ncbi:MAG TPA: hypothetical protein VFX05_02890 [Casimicrobiaceae bacterium]|nr:hypothetical protein [Casimicrobiaceae bacterium]
MDARTRMAGWALAAVVALPGATAAWAQGSAPPPAVDPKAYPSLTAMIATLQNGSEASRYCARTGGLYLEADTLLRDNASERDAVEAIVAGGKGKLDARETARLRQLAEAVVQLAAGFRQLAPESSAVAYAQSCLASTRSAPGARNQQQLDERYAAALACDRRFSAGSLDGKECVAKAFRYP